MIDIVLLLVSFLVSGVAFVVVVSLVNHRDDEDEDEWSNVGKEEADFKLWYELRDRNDKEEQVEEVFELVV